MKRLAAAILTIAFTLVEAAGKPEVLILTGEPEYGSQQTLGTFGAKLRKDHGIEVTHLHVEKKGEVHHFPGLADALEKADLLILSLRFLNLAEPDHRALDTYFSGPGPFIAIRTSTHLFDYPQGSEMDTEDRAFPTCHFGTPYRGHHGHKTSQVNYVMAGRHPVMRGVDPRFWSPDFVYGTNPLSVHCTPLMIGQALDGLQRAEFKKVSPHNHVYILSEKDEGRVIGTPHPVVWTVDGEDDKERSLVSTIGARKSFDDPNVQRLYLNAVMGSLRLEADTPDGKTWDLPEGFSASEIRWPHPERCLMAGHPCNGYERDVTLLVTIVPPDVIEDASVELRCNARWMCCARTCHPGSGNLSLQLPVTDTPVPDQQSRSVIEKAKSELPANSTEWTARVIGAPDSDFIVIRLSSATGRHPDEIFSCDGQFSATPAINAAEDGILIRVPRSEFSPRNAERLPFVFRAGESHFSLSPSYTLPDSGA